MRTGPFSKKRALCWANTCGAAAAAVAAAPIFSMVRLILSIEISLDHWQDVWTLIARSRSPAVFPCASRSARPSHAGALARVQGLIWIEADQRASRPFRLRFLAGAFPGVQMSWWKADERAREGQGLRPCRAGARNHDRSEQCSGELHRREPIPRLAPRKVGARRVIAAARRHPVRCRIPLPADAETAQDRPARLCRLGRAHEESN